MICNIPGTIYILHNQENLGQNTKSKFLPGRLSGRRTIENKTIFGEAAFIIQNDTDNLTTSYTSTKYEE